MVEHDPGRFYHCDCLDDNPHADHDDRFYHCTCIEDDYRESDEEATP